MSKTVNLPYHIEFSDNENRFKIKLKDGARGLSEGGSQASTLNVTGGGKRYGDFEPNFSHLEQRTWTGGRGNENYADDPTRYFDGISLWSLTENKLFPAPLWKFARGIRTTDEHLPSDRRWVKLIKNKRYLSVATGAITADKAYLWIKRVGEPGTLTLELQGDSGGDPDGSAVQTVTKTVSDVTGYISVFQVFDWTSTQAMASGDHIVIYGASTDSTDNCWEILTDPDTSSGRRASDGSTWKSTNFKLLYRLTDADTSRKWHFAELQGSLYAVSEEDDGSNSTLLINGDRGAATSATSTTLVDSTKSWTADRYIGAMVKIWYGTGAGQYREITDNDGTTLTVADWDVTPDATSYYVLYSTSWWTELTSTGLGVVTSMAEFNGIMYFAQGQSDNVRRMRCTAGTTHDYADDGTNKADLLYTANSFSDGAVLWRANKTTRKVSKSGKKNWGTALSFGTEIDVGSITYNITNMTEYNDGLYVFKEDGVWKINNTYAQQLPVGVNGLPGPETGQAVCTHNLYLFFSWWKSLERYYGSTLDDEGAWKGAGMPANRDGYVSGLVSLMNVVLEATDARTGTSSVHAYKDGGRHNVFQGYEAGHRIRNLYGRYNTGANPWIWIDYNGELIYMKWSLNPLKETFEHMHEAVMESSIMDMGHAETYKFFKELAVSSENLDHDNIHIEVDYQYGDDVNTSDWKRAKSLFISDRDSTEFNLGECSRMKFRLRLYTDDASVPPVINSTVLKGYEVLPVKRLWNMRIDARAKGFDQNKFYDWLWKACQTAKQIKMSTVFPGVGDKQPIYVKLEPPNTLWRFINKASTWTGVIQVTVREM